MQTLLLILALLLVACSDTTPITPEPHSDGAGGTSSSSVMASGPGAGAGGSTSCNDCGSVSGTRLKRVVRTHDDGASEVVNITWFDTKLNTYCSPIKTPDGAQRCVPLAGASAVLATHFANATCSQKVAYSSYGNCPPGLTNGYAQEFVVAECGASAWHFYALGAPFGGQLYTVGANGCAVAATQPQGTFYLIGSEVNYADFVSFTETHE